MVQVGNIPNVSKKFIMDTTGAQGMKIGFAVNPIAGMGGRVGLKGTDGVYQKAVERGAVPVAPERAREALKGMKGGHEWFTPEGIMGEELLKEFFPHDPVSVIPTRKNMGETEPEDTIRAAEVFLEEQVDLIIFCGGDGTARNIFQVIGTEIPLLGIPSGVKMYSGVFGVNPEASAELFNMFVSGEAGVDTVEIMDLDEDLYREGAWEIVLHGEAKTVYEPHYIQLGKHSYRSVDDEDLKYDLASYIVEEMERFPEHLFVLGPGSTTAGVQRILGVEYTLLGVDVLRGKEVAALDVAEEDILDMARDAPGVKIAVSVIGNQGFFLGRGNQQISPKVVRLAGLSNIYIMATPTKLKRISRIRADTGDPELNREIREKGYMRVLQGFREYRLVKVQA